MQTSVCRASIFTEREREREREREEEKMGLVVMEEASRCWVDSYLVPVIYGNTLVIHGF
jgi:hypothetical protein